MYFRYACVGCFPFLINVTFHRHHPMPSKPDLNSVLLHTEIHACVFCFAFTFLRLFSFIFIQSVCHKTFSYWRGSAVRIIIARTAFARGTDAMTKMYFAIWYIEMYVRIRIRIPQQLPHKSLRKKNVVRACTLRVETRIDTKEGGTSLISACLLDGGKVIKLQSCFCGIVCMWV